MKTRMVLVLLGVAAVAAGIFYRRSLTKAVLGRPSDKDLRNEYARTHGLPLPPGQKMETYEEWLAWRLKANY